MHAAGSDGGVHKVDIREVIKMIDGCKSALNESGDSACDYFEILGDYLKEDVVNKGKTLTFTTRMLGL
jgi:hypothetical protein